MEPRGELTIYRSLTQIGTAAKRELRDAAGRVVETTYYTPKSETRILAWRPEEITEDMLTVQLYVLRSYDQRGRLAFQNQFAASCGRVSISQVLYDEDGKKVRELATWFTPRGVRIVEALYTVPGRSIEMQCDEAGRILEVTGAMPSDLELPGGWGRELGGLSLRLVASRERGRPSQLALILSLRNRGESEGSRGLTADAYAPVELRGADGQIVPRVEPPSEFEGRACDRPEALGPARNEIAHVREYDVEEIWGRLPPGTYTAVARHCRPGSAEPLVSNAVTLTVDP